jgi:hypothetical protein
MPADEIPEPGEKRELEENHVDQKQQPSVLPPGSTQVNGLPGWMSPAADEDPRLGDLPSANRPPLTEEGVAPNGPDFLSRVKCIVQ